MRDIELEREIAATPEEIWRALTEPKAMEGWLATSVEIAGDVVSVSWSQDPPAPFVRIAEALPPSLLRLEEIPWGENPGPPKTVAFWIESESGKSVVRLAHRGFKPSPDDDGLVDALARGWGAMLQALQHMVEKFPGTNAASRGLSGPLSGSIEDAWVRITGGGERKVGDRISIAGDDATRLEGRVELWSPPHYFGVELDVPRGALLRVEAYPKFATCMLFTYGADGAAAVDRTFDAIRPWARRVFGAA